MQHLHPGRSGERGSSATPILVFFGIVILSVIFFFAFTLPKQLETKRLKRLQVAEQQAAEERAAAEAEAEKVTAKPGTATVQPAPPPPLPPTPTRFNSSRSLGQAVVGALGAGDTAKALELLGPEALPDEKAAFFRTIFDEAKLRPLAEQPLREIGDVGEVNRWGIVLDGASTAAGKSVADPGPAVAAAASPAGGVTPRGTVLEPPSAPATPAPLPGTEPSAPGGSSVAPPSPGSAAAEVEPLRLELDFSRDVEKGWKCAAVHFPGPLRAKIAAMLGEAKIPRVVALADDESNDPLKIAGHFLKAVLKQDYTVARSVTDTEKVTREKVAGLCILFEDGAYRVADSRPLSATVAGADSAWVIVKVRSDRQQIDSDFGVEMAKNTMGAWRVTGLNFSKLLDQYMKAAGAEGGVAYTPIIRTPQGGEKLVVYFDFDRAELVPRAQRQLEIVANLLRDDPNRKIRLTGHADNLGTESYNMKLSRARAFNVRESLSALGVDPQQIVSEGLGDLKPLDPNLRPDGSDNPEGRSRNRRTEIYLDF